MANGISDPKPLAVGARRISSVGDASLLRGQPNALIPPPGSQSLPKRRSTLPKQVNRRPLWHIGIWEYPEVVVLSPLTRQWLEIAVHHPAIVSLPSGRRFGSAVRHFR